MTKTRELEKNIPRDKKSKLVEITREIRGTPGKMIEEGNLDNIFYIKNYSGLSPSSAIGVDVETNRISVYDSAFFGEAVTLASLYEWLIKEKFIVHEMCG